MSDVLPAPGPSALLRLLVPVSAGLMLAGIGAFWWASQHAASVGAAEPVTVTAGACEPMEMTVPAGPRSFAITNASDRPIEWEILDGVMVVAERENIIPGLQQTVRATLAPGDYQITCGLLTNPRGVLHVSPSPDWSSAASGLELRDFLGPLGEYRVYVTLQAGQAMKAAEALRDAIAGGDLEGAQAAWRASRAPYKRIEPLAYRLSDLEAAIDPVADLLQGREDDPGFTGYHRLEYGLFQQRSLDGLGPVADRLVSDLTRLRSRLKDFAVEPSLLAALPADMARQVAAGPIASGEDRYAGTDLDDVAANLEGIAKLMDLLGPVASRVDAEAESEAADRLAATDAELAALKAPDGFPAYDQVGPEARQRLSASFQALADALTRMTTTIGVN